MDRPDELYANRPSDEFARKIIHLFQTPQVKVYVGPERKLYEVFKNALCQASPFFDRAFNGPFKEASHQEIWLEEDSVSAFEALVQYIYTGHVMPPGPVELNKSRHIKHYLEFFVLANKIDLLGSFTSVSKNLKEILLADKKLLHVTKEHIALSCHLPKFHKARELVSVACVRAFFLSSSMSLYELQTFQTPAPAFVLQNALDEVEGFESDMFRAVQAAFRGRPRQMSDLNIRDPLRGDYFAMPVGAKVEVPRVQASSSPTYPGRGNSSLFGRSTVGLPDCIDSDIEDDLETSLQSDLD